LGRGGGDRVRFAWALPIQIVAPGVTWHLRGSALALGVALAPLALRRIHIDPLTRPPALSTTERDTFTISLALMNPFALTDAARDAIATAVARAGSAALMRSPPERPTSAPAREIAMDSGVPVRRVDRAHEPERTATFFSMTDLLHLGGADEDLNPWGMSAMASLGCLCTRFTPPGAGRR
jgi:hypothetical protein